MYGVLAKITGEKMKERSWFFVGCYGFILLLVLTSAAVQTGNGDIIVFGMSKSTMPKCMLSDLYYLCSFSNSTFPTNASLVKYDVDCKLKTEYFCVYSSYLNVSEGIYEVKHCYSYNSFKDALAQCKTKIEQLVKK